MDKTQKNYGNTWNNYGTQMNKLWTKNGQTMEKTETTMGNTMETTMEKYGHNYGKHIMETTMEQ